MGKGNLRVPEEEEHKKRDFSTLSDNHHEDNVTCKQLLPVVKSVEMAAVYRPPPSA